MKTATKIIVSVALAGGVAAGVTAFAKRGDFHHFGHHDPAEHAEWVAEFVGERLNLSIEQSAKLQALIDQLLNIRRDFKTDRERDRDEFLALIRAPSLDQQQLLAMVGEKTQTVEDKAAAVIASIAEFTDSLDNEQRAELTEMLEWRFGRWHH